MIDRNIGGLLRLFVVVFFTTNAVLSAGPGDYYQVDDDVTFCTTPVTVDRKLVTFEPNNSLE